MAFSRSVKRAAQAAAGAALISAAVVVPAHAARTHAAMQPLVVAYGPTSSFVRNFNPFNFTSVDPFTQSGVFEPLYVVTDVNGKQIPWLATSYKYSDGLKTLTFTIRQGVKWSDGQPFTAKDVYFTIMLGKKSAALDKVGFNTGDVTSVTMPASNQVAIHFKTADSTRFENLVNNLYIVPEHIWSKVKDPVNFLNPNPVGTGPFTQVANFSPQGFDLGRNPYYWQKEQVSAIRVPAYNGNDGADVAIEAGNVDWGTVFLPNVQKTFVARDSQHNHFNIQPFSTEMLMVNNTEYPLSLPAFRKALSVDLNRQAFNVAAWFGQNAPTDITGLKGTWSSWIDPSISNTLAQYNPAAARTMLLKAGFTYKNGHLTDPKGKPVSLSIIVNQGYTDYIAVSQVMEQSFKALGIDFSIRLLQGSTVTSDEQEGKFQLLLNLPSTGATPYFFYHDQLSAASNNFAPIGTAVPGGSNWGRYKNSNVDQLLAQFRHTNDQAQQKSIMSNIEKIFVNDLPYIPLNAGTVGYEYNTQRYTGFPTPSDPYASGANWRSPDRLVVLTHLKPAQ
jgi:peptide/nickel transport system substrate-binding protein